MQSFTPIGHSLGFAQRMERLYPETAAILAQHVRELVEEIAEDILEDISRREISRMAEEAAHKSGMADNMPEGHNNDTLNDLSTALVVRELIGRYDRRNREHRRESSPYYIPFLFIPSHEHYEFQKDALHDYPFLQEFFHRGR